MNIFDVINAAVGFVEFHQAYVYEENQVWYASIVDIGDLHALQAQTLEDAKNEALTYWASEDYKVITTFWTGPVYSPVVYLAL
jgi:hypothetical protein